MHLGNSKVINEALLEEVTRRAQNSPRLRMNDNIFLSQETGNYGVVIPKNVWHTIQCIESATLFECKEGPFVPHEEEGVLVFF